MYHLSGWSEDKSRCCREVEDEWCSFMISNYCHTQYLLHGQIIRKLKMTCLHAAEERCLFKPLVLSSSFKTC